MTARIIPLTLQIVDAYAQVVPEHWQGLYALASAVRVRRRRCRHHAGGLFAFAGDGLRVVHAHAVAAAADDDEIDLRRRTAAHPDASFH